MDYLYGKLNNEVKYREYKGSETTTATVTIDDSSTVSVDVKKVPNELTLTTINGDTYTYDGSEPASFDIRTQVTDKVEEGNNLPVTSDAVKGYVDSKAGALEYVGGEGNFTNINGGVTVKGRLNVDDGIYSPVNSDDPNFVPNNKSVDDKITASEQKLIDERIGAFTRTEDKLFTDVEGGMTIKGHLNVDGGITSASAPTADSDVTNKGYVDDGFVHKGTTPKAVYAHDENGNESMVSYTENATSWTLVQRAAGGIVKVGTPLSARDAVTKEYVDDADAKKLNLTGGTIAGSLAIQGDLTVAGTTTTETAQTLAVKDSVIVTNADGAELGATLSGIAIRKDGENTYGVMYDPSGDSVKLGLGTLDAENKFTFNESGTDGKPIATRADSSALTDGDLVKWDGTTNSLVDSGKKTDDFVEKVTVTEGSNLAYIAKNDGTQSTVPIAQMPYQNTVAQRGTGGTLKVGTAVADSDAMPKKQVEDNFVAKMTTAGVVYCTDGDGNQSKINYANVVSNNTVVTRDANGHVRTADPEGQNDATNKKYVDSALDKKLDTYTGTAFYPVIPIQKRVSSSNPSAGYTQAWEQMSVEATNNTVAKRTAKGTLATATPISDKDATPKKYVEDNFIPKSTFTGAWQVLVTGENSDAITTRGMSVDPANHNIPNFDSQGRLLSNNPDGTAPTETSDKYAVNVGYADAHYVKSVAGTTNAPAAYIRGQDGTDKTASLDSLTASAYSVAQRDVNGNIKVGTASANGDAVNKKYAEDNFVTKVTTGNRNQAYTVDTNNQQAMMGISENASAWAIARRYTNGRLQVGTPVGVNDATTKAYVDNLNTITITAGA